MALILGTDTDDYLGGTDANDVLIGGAGGDELVGFTGDDDLSGGADGDWLDGGPGNDTLDGGVGHDVVTYHEAPSGVTVNLAAGTASGGGGNDVLIGIENVLGSWSGDNMLIGSADNNQLDSGVGNDTLDGGAGDDHLFGNAGDDSLIGGAGYDFVYGHTGNDTLDGGTGVDVAVYRYNRAAYTIDGGGAFVSSGAEGNHSLSNIERLQFSDEGLAFDLGSGEAAGKTVRVIGAAFDAQAIQQHSDWVGIGLRFFDGGMTMPTVCELVARNLALNNADFVTAVYTNVVGSAPDIATRDVFVSVLQGSGGTMTQGQLLELAANTDLNAVNINLAGLQQTGVEFV